MITKPLCLRRDRYTGTGSYYRYLRPAGAYMSLMHAILGVLEAQPMNGYRLARAFDTSTGCAVWSAPSSQIYPMLRKMEEAGFIEVESQIRGTRLERRVYSITEAGLAELRDWVGAPQDTVVKRDPILLQALFLDLIEPEVAAKVLEHLIEEQRQLVDA